MNKTTTVCLWGFAHRGIFSHLHVHVFKVSHDVGVYCSAPSVKYYYDVAMVHTDGSQKQAALLLTGMV